MIRHIVFFSAATEYIDPIVTDLSALANIPHADHFEVRKSLKIDALSSEVDVVVYAEFASEAALHEFKQHPIYSEAVRRVRPYRQLRMAADTAV
ncbi:MAG: stress responsive protein [marine bacterium B5-7]|nr:MAG: stress responsive protein [marine bacterium B5-7]